MTTLDIKGAAALLGVCPDTLRDLVAAGKAPGAKIGRSWTFVQEDLIAYIRSQYTKEAPCRSTSRKTAKSGGQTSVMPASGYVNLLEKQIAARRKSARTSSR